MHADNRMNEEREFTDLSTTLQFAFDQMMKGINTALPGIVESYDPTRRRARVRPALNLLTTDGESITPATLANVPVMFPSFGNFVLLGTVKPSDPVLLVFSQRGMSKFKQGYSATDPDQEAFFSRKDAVAFPGFGTLVTVPATTNGIAMQTADGLQSIVIEQGLIRITSVGQLNITAPNVNITGIVNITGSLIVNGTPIG